jgi:hypothetical protein
MALEGGDSSGRRELYSGSIIYTHFKVLKN